MIRIAICDDEIQTCKEVHQCLLKYFLTKDLKYSIKEFISGEDLLSDSLEFDLIFLDYYFEGNRQNGMETARKIRERTVESKIVFLTSCERVVYEAFEVNAYRFLVKPIIESQLFRVLDAYISGMEKDGTLMVKVDGEIYYIKYSKIAYIEGDGKNCIINFIDGSTPLRCKETLASIEKRLESKSFFRSHKSFLVHFKYVKSFNKANICIQNEDIVMISRYKYNAFRDAYACYLAEE